MKIESKELPYLLLTKVFSQIAQEKVTELDGVVSGMLGALTTGPSVGAAIHMRRVQPKSLRGQTS